jgi:hypothetical protein
MKQKLPEKVKDVMYSLWARIIENEQLRMV